MDYHLLWLIIGLFVVLPIIGGWFQMWDDDRRDREELEKLEKLEKLERKETK